HEGYLGVEPRMARPDLLRVRLLVDAALSLRRVLEMLDRIRDVDELAIDPRFFKRAVEQPPRRPDERPALKILLVTGLLADEHQFGFRFALAEDRLRRVLPQAASPAVFHRLCERLEGLALREVRLSRH